MGETYSLREVFLTLQGEGARTGAKSVFVRFSGCNLWSGHPRHRALGTGACAQWCDTDFARGEPHTLPALLERMDALWPRTAEPRWCVLTGGEPTLQVDLRLLGTLREHGWRIAMETNGTRDPLEGDVPVLSAVDWLTLAPKKGAPLERRSGTELKVVLPGSVSEAEGWTDDEVLALAASGTFEHLFVQPQDAIDPTRVEVSALKPAADFDADRARAQFQRNLDRCLQFVHRHPAWRLSLQTHKFIQLP